MTGDPPYHRPDRSSRSRTAGWDTFHAARAFQPFWVSLGVLFGLPALVATYLRVFPPTDDVPVLLASFISYGVLGYLLSVTSFLVALIRARSRGTLTVLTAVSASLLACHVYWLAPLFIPDHRVDTTRSFTLMSLNLHNGGADPAEVAQVSATADVVVLLETTIAATQDLKQYGWDQRFPYAVGEVPGVSDTALYSRFPLTDEAPVQGSEFQQWIATAEVPGIGPVRFIAAHPCNPYCGYNLFASEHQALRTTADANLGMPLIVAGDLNAVDDHGPIRHLHADGLESVTDIVGAGWLPTYPANRRIPALLPIDHILVNRFLTATWIHRFQVDGSDHLGLLARVAGASPLAGCDAPARRGRC
jgi:endonuclease/exonuclease/phosphatase (EEP) superfamily protein YafD